VTPLSSSLLGSFHGEAVTVALYAANVAVISASLFLMWLHVKRKRVLLNAGVGSQRGLAAPGSPRWCSSPRSPWPNCRRTRRCGCGC